MKTHFMLYVGVIILPLVMAHPTFARKIEESFGGTIACPVTHDIRVGGTELRSSSYHFYNVNTTSTLTIDQITIFDGDGVVRYSETGVNLADDLTNGAVLGPRGGTRFDLRDIFGDDNGILGDDPFHLIVNWSAILKGKELYAITQIRDRTRNATTGAISETRTRGMLDCVTIN